MPVAVGSPQEQAIAAGLAEFGERLHDPWWRITSGALYSIITKGSAEEDQVDAATVAPFIPNALQVDFLKAIHDRNVILKCRQVGFTTLISILWLDHALFNADQRCAQIAQDEMKAKEIFRDKVRFAYDRLPWPLQETFPLGKKSESALHFAHNNSMVYVGVNARGGTIDRLHISEYGKISVQFAQKAEEIMSGAIPAAKNGVIIAESTAEGQEGKFYEISSMAEARSKSPAPLRRMEWAFHFYAWWEHDEYQVDPDGVPISAEDHKYFNTVEAKVILAGKRPHGWRLSLRQRAWYVEFRTTQFAGNAPLMWREMPSLPEEAWLRSPEGVFFADNMTQAVAEQRIGPRMHEGYIPVDTFWDIGSKDGTGVWLMQLVHPEIRLLRYIEGWFKGYSFFVGWLDKIAEAAPAGFVWGTHYLPHDAAAKRQLQHRIASPRDMLQELKPTWRFDIVPQVAEKEHARQALRKIFPRLTFNVDDSLPYREDDEQAPDCRRGVRHLWNYRKKRNVQTGGWSDEEVKNEAREAADALMQLGQAFDNLNPSVRAGQRPTRTGVRRRMA